MRIQVERPMVQHNRNRGIRTRRNMTAPCASMEFKPQTQKRKKELRWISLFRERAKQQNTNWSKTNWPHTLQNLILAEKGFEIPFRVKKQR